MKILFSCRSLHNMAGGVERMILLIMAAMCDRGHEVSLVTWDHTGAESFYPVDKRIIWYQMNIGVLPVRANWRIRLKRLIWMRQTIKSYKPDVMIGFQYGVFLSLYVCALGLFIPIIAAERNAPSRFQYLPEGKGRYFVYFMLGLAKFVTVQMPSYIKGYPALLRHKIRVIPNPVQQVDFVRNFAEDFVENKIILAVGRLNFQKNLPALIDAFALISVQFPAWVLWIAGSGEDYDLLQKKILSNSSLHNKVKLLKAVSDVDRLYKQAHVFCMPSLWEGFPNALAEAMSYGLPTVGFADCAGVNDLIRTGHNGLLVDDWSVRTLARSLAQLMADEKLRTKFGHQAMQDMKVYDPQAIFEVWDSLFYEAIQ